LLDELLSGKAHPGGIQVELREVWVGELGTELGDPTINFSSPGARCKKSGQATRVCVTDACLARCNYIVFEEKELSIINQNKRPVSVNVNSSGVRAAISKF
jgi:hypothetical protein